MNFEGKPWLSPVGFARYKERVGKRNLTQIEEALQLT